MHSAVASGRNAKMLISLLFLAIVLLFVLHAFHLAIIAEDAFISFRFAKNFAAGSGLVWNIGEPPVEGYTNFLWVIICALAIRLGADVAHFAQIVGLLAGIASLLYTYLFCRKLLMLSPYISLLPALFLACSGPFATWATSGMETNLFTLLLLISSFHQVSYWKAGRKSSLFLSFFSCFLATLTRPEGIILAGAIFAAFLFRAFQRKDPKNVPAFMVSALALYALPILLYISWRFSYFGYLLPNTYYAKTGGSLYQWYRGLKYILYFSLHFLLPAAPIAAVAVWKYVKDIKGTGKRAIWNITTGETGASGGLMLCVIFCVSYVLAIIWVGGDYMAMYRFIVPILPQMYIILAVCSHSLFAEYNDPAKEYGKPPKKRALSVATLVVIGALGTVLQSTPLETVLFAKPEMTHGQYRGVLTEKWHSRRLSLIGKFFNTYKRNESESLATGAIGAIGFYSDMKIYDFYGLQDPVIAHEKGRHLGKGFPGHEKFDLLYTLSKKPTYLLFNRNLTSTPQGSVYFFPEADAILQKEYRAVFFWLVDEDNGEAGFINFLQRKMI